ncbi:MULTISPECIES: glycosyltransferase [unclassified Flavobacterium]|jgi:glycosyltransferase involved in cell wall biosynthesis|uniref:glycosyltransferase n=1 Tax=unclassified Flavobacterium TaxID=196869 RepID=UPI0025BA7F50|nr:MULTISPECIES: glycosyltransferase [unclassified Flavobacterium]
MKILFLPKYNELGPSSRYRIYQYLNAYEKAGIEVVAAPLFGSNFFTNNKIIKISFTLCYYLRRVFKLLQVYKYDLIYIEYELFPYFPSIFEKLFGVINVKYIVDYDDAIFHNYNTSRNFFIKLFLSNKIDNVIKDANYVVSGSPYLTNYISRLNANCIEIPTSVCKEVYRQKTKSETNAVFTIGWIGSRTTSVNVLKLIPAFEVLSKKMEFRLHLIGFDQNESSKLAHLNVNFINWDSKTEIEEIYKFDVGIMPLENTPFNQGKCGFKLVQYMGCSLPTIATPLDANVKINRNKKNLYAITNEDWVSAFEKVYNNQDYFREVGLENHDAFTKYYTVESNSGTYITVFNKLK